MKKIFVVDWCLVVAFPLAAITGLWLHAAGHGGGHGRWHASAVAHIVAALAFACLAVRHVVMHKGWVRRIGAAMRKGRLTLLLLAAFVFDCVTGTVLLFVAGGGAGVGLWHYAGGLLLVLLGAVHVAGRAGLLRKSVGR